MAKIDIYEVAAKFEVSFNTIVGGSLDHYIEKWEELLKKQEKERKELYDEALKERVSAFIQYDTDYEIDDEELDTLCEEWEDTFFRHFGFHWEMD